MHNLRRVMSVKNVGSLVLVLYTYTMSPKLFSQVLDCGRAPENITDYAEFKSLWKKYMCTSQNISAGATIPLTDVPIGLSYDQKDATCTDEDKQDQGIQYKVQQYISDHQSLRLAECGYRACQLLRNGASEMTMQGYYGVCGSSSGTGATGVQSTLILKTPLYSLVVNPKDFGTTKTIYLPIEGGQEANLPYKFAGSSSLSASPAQGTLFSKTEFLLPVRVTIPQRVNRGEPEYLSYYVKVGSGNNQRFLFGYVMLSRVLDQSACKLWINDKCASCEQAVNWTAFASHTTVNYSCSDMPTGVKVRATFDGYPIVTSTTDNKIWNANIEVAIHELSGTCSGPGCTQCHGCPYPGPPSWTHFNIFADSIVPATGRSEWQLTLGNCGTGPSQAQCGTSNDSKIKIEAIDKSFFDSFTLSQKQLETDRNRELEAVKSAVQ